MITWRTDIEGNPGRGLSVQAGPVHLEIGVVAPRTRWVALAVHVRPWEVVGVLDLWWVRCDVNAWIGEES